MAVEVEQLGGGFLVPPLIRFVNGEDAYISMTNGGPHAFFNIEDHLSKSTGVENTKFQVGGLMPAKALVLPRAARFIADARDCAEAAEHSAKVSS